MARAGLQEERCLERASQPTPSAARGFPEESGRALGQPPERREASHTFRYQRREGWQQFRKDLWDYRANRAEEIWDNARDFYDDVFDDTWWGYWGWGTWWPSYYPSDPWWWWTSATWNSLENFVSVPTDPTYVDYGVNVVYEGDTVYVDNQPFPAEQYDKPILEAAANVK